jgi:hypothetical protein
MFSKIEMFIEHIQILLKMLIYIPLTMADFSLYGSNLGLIIRFIPISRLCKMAQNGQDISMNRYL